MEYLSLAFFWHDFSWLTVWGLHCCILHPIICQVMSSTSSTAAHSRIHTLTTETCCCKMYWMWCLDKQGRPSSGTICCSVSSGGALTDGQVTHHATGINTPHHTKTDAGTWTLLWRQSGWSFLLFSPKETTSVISPNYLKCGQIRPQETFFTSHQSDELRPKEISKYF